MASKTESILDIAAEVLNIQSDQLDLSMSPDDVQSWDSLAHLRLVTAVESEHNLRLSMKEIQEIRCLGDFERLIIAKS